MGERAIKVVGMNKHYRLGVEERGTRRFRHDTLSETLCRSLSRLTGTQRTADSAGFWALRDVSFEVEPGEVMGILGRNGSGKSTLLKILSRITEPTSGYADIEGRVGSLLEVGTGFHPQLTGRENIYLNGAILGMTQAEVRRKFDEIVDFSEVERFLDTPVKNYSSGMYTRLAFAVAAYLETEILIVDEVLAVGDAEFQKKCLGKMQSVADREGRTVLFVSHQLAAVRQLTHRCVVLQKGEVAYVGETASAIEKYLGQDGCSTSVVYDVERAPRKQPVDHRVKLTQLRFGCPVAHFAPTDDVSFVATMRAAADADDVQFSVTIFTQEGIPVGNSHGVNRFSLLAGELCHVKIVLPSMCLTPGRYHCRVALGQGKETGVWKQFDAVAETLNFEVVARVVPATAAGGWKRGLGNIVFPKLEMQMIDLHPAAVPARGFAADMDATGSFLPMTTQLPW